jgi:anthranilate phosphoribosyltransferase
VAPVRKELGVKTFFNMLGPMVNPSLPARQLTGVFSLELARLYAYLFQQTDTEFMVVFSLDGYDEVSLTGEFKILTRDDERIIGPDDLGLHTFDPSELSGGKTVEEAANIFLSVLKNQSTRAQKEVAIANAAMAIYCANSSLGIQGAVDAARESLESGKALESFNTLMNI